MEKESQVNLKIKPETTLKALDDMLEAQKFNLYCSDVIKAYKDIIKARFGSSELDTLVFEYSKGTQHLKIRDLKTNDTFTTSCHAGGKHGKYNPKMINFLIDMMGNSIVFRDKEKTKTSESNKWIKYAPKWKIVDDENETTVEAKSKSKSNHGGLDDWFKKEKWVDVSRPKKGGGYEACGRGDTSKGKKPVCTPANKAKNLTDKERKNRIRQKRQKEKEPNPDKKPNITTYSPGAGGKSNVSKTQNIRLVKSMIPLSELRPEQSKFVKIALLGEEDEIPTTDVSGMFSEMDDKISNMSEQIQEKAFTELEEILSHHMGLIGPSESIVHSVKFYENPVQEDMTEEEYLRFIRYKVAVLKRMHKQSIEDQDSKMYEITYKMRQRNTNPFNYSEVAELVREVLDK